jgi:hypothetical protein
MRALATDEPLAPAPLAGAVEAGLAVFALATLLAVAVTGIVHLDDRFQMTHVAGAWMGLAQAAHDGLLYPPLFDGAHYGGTRFMPLPILLHAGIAELTGEYLTSGKLVNLVGAGLLAAVVFVATGRNGLGLAPRLALTAVIWFTVPGQVAAFSIRNDALPVALQLAAVLLVGRRRGTMAPIAAGLLCALAMLCKLSAIWGPAAIGCYLLFRHWRGLFAFVPATLLPLAAGIAGFDWLSDGRMLDSLLGLTLPDGNFAVRALDNLPRLTADLLRLAQPAALLLGFALVAVAAAALRWDLRIRHLALLLALAVTMLVYADRGADWNHLIDVVALVSVVLAALWGAAPRAGQLLLGVLVLWLALTLQLTERTPFTLAAEAVAGDGPPRDPLGDLVTPGQTLLSDDPYWAVERGQRPVVLDAFMYKRMAEADPEFGQELIARIGARAFDRIVVMFPLHEVAPGDLGRSPNFGAPVWRAMQQNYRLVGTADDVRPVYVFAPAP